MYEYGKGTEKDESKAYFQYARSARAGNQDGMKGLVRVTAQKDNATVDNCKTALEYASQSKDSEFINSDTNVGTKACRRAEMGEIERKS